MCMGEREGLLYMLYLFVSVSLCLCVSVISSLSCDHAQGNGQELCLEYLQKESGKWFQFRFIIDILTCCFCKLFY